MEQDQLQSATGPYVSIHEAAQVLGVAPDVVRIWANNKILPGARIGGSQHDQWVFARSTVEEKAALLGSHFETMPQGMPLSPRIHFRDLMRDTPSYSVAVAGYVADRKIPLQRGLAAELAPPSHRVLFYEDEAVLIDSLERQVVQKLESGEIIMLALSERHMEALEGQLVAHGFSTAAAARDGRFVLFDVNWALMQVQLNGVVDWTRFYRIAAGYVGAAASRGKPVNIISESVATLLARNDIANLIRLEGCWNSLTAMMPFTLTCAYPIHSFGQPALERPLRDVLASHGQTVPPESYSQLESEEARARMIVKLQQDVTLLRQHMHEVARKEYRDQAANLDHARDNFIRLTTHHLRTPATVIKLYVSMLLDGYAGKKFTREQKQYLEAIAASNDREIAVINDLLLVAQLDAGAVTLNIEQHDIVTLIREAMAADIADVASRKHDPYNSGAAAKVRFKEHAPLFVPVDRHYIRLVLGQLLSNTHKHASKSQPLAVDISLPQSNGQVSIVIRDTGAGLPAKYQSKLYQKFANPTDERYEPGGIGLGLYWSKRIAELHGGSLHISTRTGRGTTAILTLPLSGEAKEAADAADTALVSRDDTDDGR